MRELTDAEARVIAAVLSASPERERERLLRADVPRSTYHAARKRAYEEGWLRDRYVPDPSRFGRPHATFVLVRPFVDRSSELVENWRSEQSNVVLWSSPQIALGVFFWSTKDAERRWVSRFDQRRLVSWKLVLGADLDGPSVPVYFDHEGLWAHLSDLAGTVAYPHGLGGLPLGAETAAPSSKAHLEWALGELIARPFRAVAQGKAGHLVGPFGLPFSHQRLLAKGWVTHRVFLDPSRLPAYRGRSADQVFFITGSLRSGAQPETLFATLTRDCRVFPFLYVLSQDRLLIGALGGHPTNRSAADGARRPVMATVQEAVQGIEIVHEEVANLAMIVDHRYDKLFPAKSPV